MLSQRELAFIALYKDTYPRIHKFVLRRIEDPELGSARRNEKTWFSWRCFYPELT